jgi:Ca-activated chloride channel family protein
MKRPRRILLILLLFFTGVPAIAQKDSLPLFSSTTLRVDVDLVNVAFNVFDKNQRQVENLQKGDLDLYEDEVRQEISLFGQESTSLSVIVLMDTSESLAPFIKQVESLNRLLPSVFEPGDEVAVITFSDSPIMLLDFTEDKTKVRTALEHQLLLSPKVPLRNASDSIFIGGSTNINDSVYIASKKLEMSGSEKRKMIVLLSDGQGNRGDSVRAYDELRVSGATLMSIGLGLTSKFRRSPMLVNRWIKDTGGALLLYSPEPELRENLQSVFRKVRSRYGIAYSPSNKKKDGQYRRIRMEVSKNSPYALRNLTIRGPQGYFAPLGIFQH